MDRKGKFSYEANPKPLGPVPTLGMVDPMMYGTPPMPVPAGAKKANRAVIAELVKGSKQTEPVCAAGEPCSFLQPHPFEPYRN